MPQRRIRWGGGNRTFDRECLLCGFAYAAIGMGLGVYMGASGAHVLFIAHAHILLVGFVVSLIYGLTHKLWMTGSARRLAGFPLHLHQFTVLEVTSGLLVLLFGGVLPEATLGPVLGAAAVGVLLAMMLMAWPVRRLQR